MVAPCGHNWLYRVDEAEKHPAAATPTAHPATAGWQPGEQHPSLGARLRAHNRLLDGVVRRRRHQWQRGSSSTSDGKRQLLVHHASAQPAAVLLRREAPAKGRAQYQPLPRLGLAGAGVPVSARQKPTAEPGLLRCLAGVFCAGSSGLTEPSHVQKSSCYCRPGRRA